MAKITWSWTDNSGDETGFQLCDANGNVVVDNIPADATSVDEPIATTGSYTRKVRAFNASGNSAFSNSATVTFSLNIPTNFTAVVDPLTGIVTYNWTGNEEGATYQICDENGVVKVDAIAAGATVITEQLTELGVYNRKIRCVNALGTSDFTVAVQLNYSLETPSNLVAVFEPATLKVTYTWSCAQPGVGFQIGDNAGIVKVDEITPGVFTVQENINGQGVGTFVRKIRSYTAAAVGAWSTAVQFTYTISAPSGLAATFNGLIVTYTWADNSVNEVGFQVCDENGNVKAEAAAGATSCTETLTAGAKYTRKVKAVNIDGASDYSNSISFNLAVVVSTADIAQVQPGYIMIHPDEVLNSGDIQYFASRDDGNTWNKCIKDIEQIINSQPAGVTVRAMAIIYGDALLNGWSYTWR